MLLRERLPSTHIVTGLTIPQLAASGTSYHKEYDEHL